MARTGRPSKLTPELQKSIVQSLAYGIDIETACLREGIARSTFYDWLNYGKAGREPYADFFTACEQAMAEVERKITASILLHTKKSWQAGAWWVKWRKTQGRQQVELTGKDGAPLQTNGLTAEAAEVIRETILFGREKPKQERAETAAPLPEPPPDEEHEEVGAEDDPERDL